MQIGGLKMKYMLIDKIVYHYKCPYCNYEIRKEKFKDKRYLCMPICPVCNPEILIEGILKIIKEIKEVNNGENSSNKAQELN